VIGQLIARIGDGAWFGVGTGITVTAGASGYIYLAYNDSAYSDNTGFYSASITNNGTGRIIKNSIRRNRGLWLRGRNQETCRAAADNR
jgi:hypothetical protein